MKNFRPFWRPVVREERETWELEIVTVNKSVAAYAVAQLCNSSHWSAFRAESRREATTLEKYFPEEALGGQLPSASKFKPALRYSVLPPRSRHRGTGGLAIRCVECLLDAVTLRNRWKPDQEGSLRELTSSATAWIPRLESAYADLQQNVIIKVANEFEELVGCGTVVRIARQLSKELRPKNWYDLNRRLKSRLEPLARIALGRQA